MAMKVQILSRETIKPSSPTPHHLRTFKLSFFHQFIPPMYASVLYFYPSIGTNVSQNSVHLKKSLSKTLTHFYPFAGRFKDNVTVDCNDEGVDYIETYIASDMSLLLKKQDNYCLLTQLFPRNIISSRTQTTCGDEILSVQVNNFRCGTRVIGVCIWHEIADASSMATFVNSWAAIARGSELNESFIFHFSDLFPPRVLTSPVKWDLMNPKLSQKLVTKKFLFDGFKIAALRDKLSNGPLSERPTRVEAVSALIWGVIVASVQATNQSLKQHIAFHQVNVRKKINPPFPLHCLGSIAMPSAIGNWPTEKTLDYKVFATKIRESIRSVTDEYVRMVYENLSNLLLAQGAKVEELANNPEIDIIVFASWCRFPFYEADFGWGKPNWIVPGAALSNGVVLVDTTDGVGIEAWVKMAEENMAVFEQNEDFLSFASL